MHLDLARAIENNDVPFISGKQRGAHLRKLFELDRLDDSDIQIVVRIPKSIKSISSSFSLGLFSESVEHLGSLDAFVRRFKFEGENSVIEKIIASLSRGKDGPPNLEG